MKQSVMICVPAYGQSMMVHTGRALYDIAIALTLAKVDHRLLTMSAADIEDLRNLFITIWYDEHPEISHLLFIDADMGFPPQLVTDMLRFNKPLMGTFYMRRSMEASVVGLAPEGHSIADVKQGFIRALGIGGGVMMISREVIKTMLEKIPGIEGSLPGPIARANPKLKRFILAFDKIKTDDVRLSEDLAFCHRWMACGGEIWANVAHKISHVGPFDFHLRYQGVLEAKASAQAAA